MTEITRISDLNYHPTLMASRGAVLVYFTAPDCGACRSLKADLQAWQKEYPPYQALPVFEVDAVESAGLVNEFEIFHLPTLFLYKDGQFHAELKCMASPASIEQTLQAASRLPAEEEP